MRWRDLAAPVRMQRVALVSPAARVRELLVCVAASGAVQFDARSPGLPAPPGSARALLEALRVESTPEPRLCRDDPDPIAWSRQGRTDLLAGEAELQGLAATAHAHGDLVALAGWAPSGAVAALAPQLAAAGGGVCRLEPPPGTDPPTLLPPGGQVRRSFVPLVDTYATVPYVDLDPTLAAGAAYVVMFGMMFGDAGHGLLLVLCGLALRLGHPVVALGVRRTWPFVVAAGLSATVFGLLYGEFFGPTGVVPVLWLSPLEQPVVLVSAAIGLGAVLLSGAFVMGGANRWREGGWPLALVSASGVAGGAVFAGAGCVLLGLVTGSGAVTVLGAVVVLGGLGLCFLGFFADGGGGAVGLTQATVELFDTTLRLGANVVSFARLAAFGLTHAALGLVVWQLTLGLWHAGPWFSVLAVAVFLVGTTVAFALEALVAGVQALRLSYFELFSRVFASEGQPFQPWRVPVEDSADPVGSTVPMEVGEAS
jgi:V/A-type H+-transporting ATPase subunit I